MDDNQGVEAKVLSSSDLGAEDEGVKRGEEVNHH